MAARAPELTQPTLAGFHPTPVTEQIVELEGVLWFVGIVLASRVEYQRKSSLYQSPNGSIQLQLQLSIEPLGCLVL